MQGPGDAGERSQYDETLCYVCGSGDDEGNLIVCDREGAAHALQRVQTWLWCMALRLGPAGWQSHSAPRNKQTCSFVHNLL